MTKQTRFNYAFIAITLLYAIFTGLFKLRGVYYIELLFLVMSMINTGVSSGNLKYAFRQPAIIIWSVWLVYTFIVRFFAGYRSDNEIYSILHIFFLPISVMIIVFVEAMKNMRRTTLFILVIETLFVILGLTLQSRGSGTGTGWEARGGMDLGNALPLNAVTMAFFAAWAYVKGYIKERTLYILLAISLMGIFFTSTRKAFAGWAIGCVFVALTKFDYHKPANLFKLAVIAIIAYMALQLMMTYTMMGQRFNQVEDAGEFAMRNYETVWWLKPLGDRALHYILGWELFLEHPIFGIGIHNFQSITNFAVPIHSEYIVQLCECGIIGTVLYLLFNYQLLKGILKHKKYISNKEGLILLSALATLYFISLTAWQYDAVRIFAQNGIIIAACTKYVTNHRKRKQN